MICGKTFHDRGAQKQNPEEWLHVAAPSIKASSQRPQLGDPGFEFDCINAARESLAIINGCIVCVSRSIHAL